MRELVVSGVMLLGAFGLFMASGVHREAPLVGHSALTGDVTRLESHVAHNPGDVDELAELCRDYLDRNSPGLAIAAIHRAPSDVRDQPVIRTVWARALLHDGHASEALAKQREAVAACSSTSCSPWLLASAMRQESFLSAMVSHGVEDYRRDPDNTVRAFNAVRGTTVAMLEAPVR